jgi:hypothetical protein
VLKCASAAPEYVQCAGHFDGKCGEISTWCWFGAGLVFIEPAFSPVRDVAEAKERHVDQEFARQNFRHCERVGCT